MSFRVTSPEVCVLLSRLVVRRSSRHIRAPALRASELPLPSFQRSVVFHSGPCQALARGPPRETIAAQAAMIRPARRTLCPTRRLMTAHEKRSPGTRQALNAIRHGIQHVQEARQV